MATLTTANKALVQQLIDNMVQGSAYEKPLDGTIAHDLSILHAAFGFPSQIVFLDALRDRPFSALLQALLAVAA